MREIIITEMRRSPLVTASPLAMPSRDLYFAAGAPMPGEGDMADNVVRLFQEATKPAAQKDTVYKVVKNAGGKASEAEIYLYDEIGFWGVSATQFAKDLKALGAVETIHLHISSDGGEVFDGRAIYNQLASHKARVIVYVDGIAASIASLIAMAGNEIRMGDGSFMMIHNAWTIAVGNASEMRRKADTLDLIDGSIRKTYASRTKQPVDKIKTWMDDETWMDAETAVERGFADVVAAPLQVAARLRNATRYSNIPAALKPSRVSAADAVAAMRKTIAAAAA